LLEDRQFPQQDETGVRSDRPLEHGLSTDAGDEWRDTRALTLQKISPAISLNKTTNALSELRRYLLVASAFLTAGLALALVDEKWHAPHVAAAASVLMLGVVATSLVAIYRARKAAEGFARAVAPSMRDKVTNLPNEEYFRLRLRDEFKRMQRYGAAPSLAVFDVNNLASVNEAYGEAAGDAVLKHIADLIEMTKRASDVAVRLGDDEFALILLECGEEDAMRFLRRLERYITRRPVTVNVEGQAITLWVGVCSGLASAQQGDTSPPDLLAQARHSLDAAKEERDRRRERWTSASG
jgi:diguanylate cyclase (GGDEF)-like protein